MSWRGSSTGKDPDYAQFQKPLWQEVYVCNMDQGNVRINMRTAKDMASYYNHYWAKGKTCLVFVQESQGFGREP